MLSFNKTVFTVLTVVSASFCVLWADAARAEEDSSGFVDVSALNMRACPGRECAVIRVLEKDALVVVTGEAGDWLKVRHDGKKGYVYGKNGYLRRDPELAEARMQAEEVEREISEKQDAVSEMKERAAAEKAALEEAEREMVAAMRSLEQVREDVSRLERRMEETEKKTEKLREDIGEKKKYAQQRLVALYKLNRLGGMNLLASAESTGDLFRRKAAIETILARDEETIRAMAEMEERLAGLHARAADEKAEKEMLANRYEEAQKVLARKKEERKKLLAAIQTEKSEALREIELLRESARRLDETMAALKRRAQEKKDDAAGIQKAFSEYQGLLKMPVEGRIVSKYGRHTEPHSGATGYRNGIEIQAGRGAPIKAVFDGEVSFADWLQGFGRVVIVFHGNSFYTVYGHLEDVFANEGDRIEAGEVIATLGDTGSSSGPVLYFEIRHKGDPLDPLDWIEKG